ncbi:MAG: cytochrome c-type biogenesis protein CcmH [Gammaproteobacteria bacterium]|nr:cytochrome c-type biogenesis protein CcmH [Gammaproteobacteria bacterium]
MDKLIRIILACLLVLPTISSAAIEAYEFKNEQMETDYNQLIKELRCLVCQNQNLSGSDADLARDLRRQTHEMLMQGNRPEQVIQYMVDRYGDFVLYRPQFKSSTFLLWTGPFILVAIVLWLVIRRIRTSQKLVEPDDKSMQRARDLLSSDRDNS